MKRIGIFILLAAFCLDCSKLQKEDHLLVNDQEKVIPLTERRIVAVTDYNSTNYFIYKGQPMGFQFEMLQKMSNHLGIKLEVIVENDVQNKFELLESGECDIIADNLTVTKERKDKFAFTHPLGTYKQVLVQRVNADGSSTVNSQLDLAGKTVHVKANTSFVRRLQNLSDEIGDTIYIVQSEEDIDQLIEKVANGEIDYTVAEDNIAHVNRKVYSNLNIDTDISFPQYSAWAVRKDDGQLQEAINSWLEDYTKTTNFKIVYNKYFKNQYIAKKRTSDYFVIQEGKVSLYDKTIKKYSDEIGWDWRLLASMIYQESRFNPTVKSWAGAFGLMQLMPNTASRFGVDSLSTPQENIRAGVEFIKWLTKQLDEKGVDPEEKIKFILASYNAGYGHVLDAMRLAEKNGKDPLKWDDNVDYYLLNKSKPEFFNDPVVYYGYCRGSEPYNYVIDILERYEHYKNIIALNN